MRGVETGMAGKNQRKLLWIITFVGAYSIMVACGHPAQPEVPLATATLPSSQPTTTTIPISVAPTSLAPTRPESGTPSAGISPTPVLETSTPVPLQQCPLIAYERQALETKSIAVVDPCGQQPKFSLNDKEYGQSPKWSPDGKYIAFLSTRGQNQSQDSWDLWLLDIDTQELAQLTRGENIPPSESSFIWSPDGSEILYSSGQDNDNGTIETRVLTVHDHSIRVVPDVWAPFSWSPNGEKIALTTIVEPLDTPAEGYEESAVAPGQLVIIRPNGDRVAGGTRESLYPLQNAGEWLWSPDSQLLAVAFFNSARGDGDLELVAIRENKLVTVSRLHDLIPSVAEKAIESLSWSPTGEEIAFVVIDYSRLVRPYWGQVLVVDRDFTSFRTLTPEDMFCEDVQWSPDDSQLVFVCDDGEPYSSIWLVNADGSGLHAITKPAPGVRHPQWQPLQQP